MRPTRVAGLVMLWLLSTATWSWAQGRLDDRAGRANSRSGRVTIIARGSEETRAAKGLHWQVEGFGETDKDAEDQAYIQACAVVAAFMHEQGSSRDWYPRTQDIKKISSELKRGTTEIKEPGRENYQYVMLEVVLKPRDFHQFQHDASQQRGMQRMQGLGKGLGLFLALLAALAGYFRLEEATKGYYTAWLRVGAVSFIAVIAAGVWYLPGLLLSR